jgi:hypothetical protein
MADETLEWELKVDADVGGVTKLDSALGRLEDQLEQANRQLIRMEQAGHKAAAAHDKHEKHAHGLRGALDRLVHQGMEPFLHKAKEIAEFEFLRETTEKLLELPGELAEKIADLGKEMVLTAAKAERFDMAFKNALGAEGGEQALGYIEKVAKHTEYTQEQLKGLSLELSKAGYKGTDLGRAVEASMDLGAMSSNPQEGAQRAMSALERVRATGKLEARALVPFGISEQALMDEVGKETGMSSKGGQSATGAKVASQVQKALEAGRVPIETELNSLYTLITKKTGKALGGAAVEMGTTLEAKLSHLHELPELYFEKLKDSHGYERVSEQIGKLLDGLDPDSPRGKRIFGTLEVAFDHIADVMANFDLAGAIEAGVDALDNFTLQLVEAMSYIPGEVGRHAAMAAAQMNARRLAHARKLGQEEAEANAKAKQEALDQDASRATAGLYEEFPASERIAAVKKGMYRAEDDETPWLFKKGEQEAKAAESAGEAIGKATIRGTKKSLKMHSPSRVMQDLADDATDSFADRVETNADRVEQAMRVAVAAPAAAGGRSSGPSQITLAPNIVIHQQPGQSAEELAAAVWDKIRDLAAGELQSAVEQMAMQFGSAA